MKKIIPLLIISALFAVSCSHGVSRIQTRSLPGLNPTNYTFPLPVETVHDRALEAFSIDHQITKPIFSRSALSQHLEDIFDVECATNAVFGTSVFGDPANTNDIYLHTFGSPFVISTVYHGRNGGLPYVATFQLHLTANDSNTLVVVTASQTQVINGTKFGIGPCGPGQGYNFENVKPTTVEEYSILRYLGNYLGITNMPGVILPKP